MSVIVELIFSSSIKELKQSQLSSVLPHICFNQWRGFFLIIIIPSSPSLSDIHIMFQCWNVWNELYGFTEIISHVLPCFVFQRYHVLYFAVYHKQWSIFPFLLFQYKYTIRGNTCKLVEYLFFF